jgi:hypothetical protein
MLLNNSSITSQGQSYSFTILEGSEGQELTLSRVYFLAMNNTLDDLNPASLAPLLKHIATLDLSGPASASASLNTHFPADGPFIKSVAALMRAGVANGSLCNRGSGSVRFSRVFKYGEGSFGFSADAVLMDGPGPLHRHPLGEVDLCLTESGEPSFDGKPAGWVVYPPGSTHVPTVSDGSMLILYLLPQGSIDFL